MAYFGMTRIDLGPFKPFQKSIKPVCQVVGQKQKNGMECKIETHEGDLQMITAFDDNAIIDVMNAATRNVPIRRTLALSGTGSPELTKISFMALNENPEYGMAGDPISAALTPAGDVVKKAISAHGRFVKSGETEMAGEAYFIMDLICGKIPLSIACPMGQASPAMLEMEKDAWARVSGFGNLVNLKVNSKFVWRVYINNLRHFAPSGPECPKAVKISPEKVVGGIERCGLAPFSDLDGFICNF